MARTLVVHEWLEAFGGAERVVEAVVEATGAAGILALWNAAPERFSASTTWAQQVGLAKSKQLAVPLMPMVWRTTRIPDCDRVVVSSHAFAHHYAARVARRGIGAYAYIHSPARYLWAPDVDSRGSSSLAKIGGPSLRAVDRRSTSPRVSYAANSQYIAERVLRTWGRPAQVIYPPVRVRELQGGSMSGLSETELETLAGLPTDFVLGASRMVPYKRLDAAIEAGALTDMPTVLVGDGPDKARLMDAAKARAQGSVIFLGSVSNAMMREVIRRASVLVFRAVEDFGILPVEAMALGTPVVVNAIGGARESAEICRGGISIDDDCTPQEFRYAVETAMTLCSKQMAERTLVFDEAEFRVKIQEWTHV